MLINDGLPFQSRDAREHFATRQEFIEARRRGLIRWVVRSVAIDASVPDSVAVRAQAARLVVPEHAVASDHYAAFVLGVDTKPPGRRWELRPSYLVLHSRYRSTSDRAVVRQSKRIPDEEVLELGGLRFTTPLRTAADLLRLGRRPYALAAADAMAHGRLVTPDDLCSYIAELHRLPGLVQAQELATRVSHLPESHGESWQRCRILDVGFPRPHLQHPVTDSYGIERRLDMAYEEVRVAAEYDGREFHSSDHDRSADTARRSDLATREGWRFVLGTFERVFGTSPELDYELGAFLGLTPKPRTWY
jgi:hypothetical protein